MKKIALINDLSGFGRCSLTASIPVISVMGIQACPLPTAILSAQTGFSSYWCDDYTNRMDYITNEWTKIGASFDGIHSGYLASPEQIEKVLHFLDVFKTHNTLYLADPVMGDHGKPIKSFRKELLQGMKKLCKRADICTPNLTELCLLVGKSYDRLTAHANNADYIDRIAEIARCFIQNESKLIVLVTGIVRQEGDKHYIGNLAVNSADTIYTETVWTGKSFSGTGDLFASVLCGALVKGMQIHDALQLCADFLQPAIEEASMAGTSSEHGVFFEKYLSVLCNCHTVVDSTSYTAL